MNSEEIIKHVNKNIQNFFQNLTQLKDFQKEYMLYIIGYIGGLVANYEQFNKPKINPANNEFFNEKYSFRFEDMPLPNLIEIINSELKLGKIQYKEIKNGIKEM